MKREVFGWEKGIEGLWCQPRRLRSNRGSQPTRLSLQKSRLPNRRPDAMHVVVIFQRLQELPHLGALLRR